MTCPAKVAYPNESSININNNRIIKRSEKYSISTGNNVDLQLTREPSQNSSAQEGTDRHKYLENFFLRIPKNDYSDPKKWELNKNETKYGLTSPIKKTKKIVSKMLKKGYELVDIKPEMKVFNLHNKIFIQGEIDLCLIFFKDNIETYLIIDWKYKVKSRHRTNHRNQVKIYSQILKDNGHNVYMNGYLISHKNVPGIDKIDLEEEVSLEKLLSQWESQDYSPIIRSCEICPRNQSLVNPCPESKCESIFDINITTSKVGFREIGIKNFEWKKILQQKSIVIKKGYSTNYIKLDDDSFDISIEQGIDWNHNYFDVRGSVVKKYQDTDPNETHILIEPKVFLTRID